MYEVRAKDFMRAANTTVSSLSSPHMNLMSSFLVGKKSGPTVELTGYGMGHGVGLCQYGAQELAGAGQSWQNILAWYYPKAEVNT
jgi:stage II sporulation protein D